MLKRFEVSNYRNFRNSFVLDLRTSHDYQFNTQCVKDGLVNNGIIYAKNARGKSNLGHAIMDIRNNFTRADRLSRNMDVSDDPGFLNADGPADGAAHFSYLFEIAGSEVAYEYWKDADQRIRREKLTVDGTVAFSYDHLLTRMLEQNLSIIGAENANWQFGDAEISLLSYLTNTVPSERSSLLFSLRRFISGMVMLSGDRDTRNAFIATRQIVRSNSAKEFENFLKRYGVDESLVVASGADGREDLYLTHANGSLPFLKYASSGTLALASFFSAYELRNGYTFVYLDEFDAFYHFELAEKLVEHLSESACQTIASSHNTSLLSNSIMRPDCFFILGKERLCSLVDATDRELREGHNLERLYKNGEFDTGED